MKELIKVLFKESISKGEYEYSLDEIESNWIGANPAQIKDIEEKEKELKVKFPDDYKELLQITNGFKTSNDTIEPSFLEINEVDYLKNIVPFLIECYEDTLPELEDSILIAGKVEEQKFLLIPPSNKIKEWRYWKFANWIPGEEEFDGINAYLEYVINFLTKEKS